MHYTFQRLFLHCTFCFSFFLIGHNRKQVLLIKIVILFLKPENIFFLVSTLLKWSYSQRFDVDQRCETRR